MKLTVRKGCGAWVKVSVCVLFIKLNFFFSKPFNSNDSNSEDRIKQEQEKAIEPSTFASLHLNSPLLVLTGLHCAYNRSQCTQRDGVLRVPRVDGGKIVKAQQTVLDHAHTTWKQVPSS